MFIEHLIWVTHCSQSSTFSISLVPTTTLCGHYSSHFTNGKMGTERLSYLPTFTTKLGNGIVRLSDFMPLTNRPNLDMNGSNIPRFSKLICCSKNTSFSHIY